MAIPRLEAEAAIAIVGLAIVQSMSMYREACPPLADLRGAPAGDWRTRQLLLDADIYGGIAVITIGGTVGILTRSYLPFVISSTALLLMSLWHRSVLNSASPDAF